MALTLESEQRLSRVRLDEFFSASNAEWEKLARQSYKFVRSNFPEEATVRPDDVAKALIPLLEVNSKLSDYLGAEKLKQKYWTRDFCDLIIDRCWERIAKS